MSLLDQRINKLKEQISNCQMLIRGIKVGVDYLKGEDEQKVDSNSNGPTPEPKSVLEMLDFNIGMLNVLIYQLETQNKRLGELTGK